MGISKGGIYEMGDLSKIGKHEKQVEMFRLENFLSSPFRKSLEYVAYYRPASDDNNKSEPPSREDLIKLLCDVCRNSHKLIL